MSLSRCHHFYSHKCVPSLLDYDSQNYSFIALHTLFIPLGCLSFSPSPRKPATRSIPKPNAVEIPTTSEIPEYWNDQRIHVLGNKGFTGALHAAIANLSTKMIDVLAYEGQDVRREVARRLTAKVSSKTPKILDLCCGVGVSTRALARGFPNATTVTGVDTSNEMVSMAQFLSKHLKSIMSVISIVAPPKYACHKLSSEPIASTDYFAGNAERTGLDAASFDLVTIMYAFHEAPRVGRRNMLSEARRVLKPGGTLAVVDIDVNYEPSKSMLQGEPYILEYQKNIHSQMQAFAGFTAAYQTIVPGRVGMWTFTKPRKFSLV